MPLIRLGVLGISWKWLINKSLANQRMYAHPRYTILLLLLLPLCPVHAVVDPAVRRERARRNRVATHQRLVNLLLGHSQQSQQPGPSCQLQGEELLPFQGMMMPGAVIAQAEAYLASGHARADTPPPARWNIGQAGVEQPQRMGASCSRVCVCGRGGWDGVSLVVLLPRLHYAYVRQVHCYASF